MSTEVIELENKYTPEAPPQVQDIMQAWYEGGSIRELIGEALKSAYASGFWDGQSVMQPPPDPS